MGIEVSEEKGRLRSGGGRRNARGWKVGGCIFYMKTEMGEQHTSAKNREGTIGPFAQETGKEGRRL